MRKKTAKKAAKRTTKKTAKKTVRKAVVRRATKKVAKKVTTRRRRRYNITASKPIQFNPPNKFKRGDRRKKASRPLRDSIQWVNKTSKARDITLVGWPFLEPQQATIHVNARDVSDVFNIDPGGPKHTYKYSVTPKLDGPPDGPAVIVNG